MWRRLHGAIAQFRAESEKRWWLYLGVAVVAIVVQSRLAEAADWIIGLLNASGLPAELVRGLVAPIGLIALVIVALAILAYHDTRAQTDRAHVGKATQISTTQGAPLLTMEITTSEAVGRLIELMEAVGPSLRVRHGSESPLTPPPADHVALSLEDRTQRFRDWAAGRAQLIGEGEEIALVMRGLALRDGDDGFHKDLVTSITDRRAKTWIDDAGEFEDFWVSGPPLTTGYIRRFAAGLTYRAAPAPKPVWRQKRVRDVEMRLDRLRNRSAPLKPSNPKANAGDPRRADEP